MIVKKILNLFINSKLWTRIESSETYRLLIDQNKFIEKKSAKPIFSIYFLGHRSNFNSKSHQSSTHGGRFIINPTYLMADLINVVALVKAKPEHIKDAEPLVKDLAEASRKEEGVAKYEIYKVNEKAGVYVFLEQYKTQAAFDAHRQTEHFKKTIADVKDFLLEPPTIVTLEKEDI